jgi:hypothetical protein
MMAYSNSRLLLLLAIPCMIGTTARADFILNTGFESGALLANGQTVTEYSLVSRPAGSVPGLIAVTSGGNFPIPPWLADNADSTWIRPNNNPGTNLESDPVGQYIFETTFDLGMLDPSTASLSGRFATDNAGRIQLNGNDLGISSTGFTTWTDVDIAPGGSLFVSGVNSLRFVVDNAPGLTGNPVGLRAEFTVRAVPEPATPLLIAVIAIPFAVFNRRNRLQRLDR